MLVSCKPPPSLLTPLRRKVAFWEKFVFFLSLSLSQSSIFPWQMFICSSSPHSRVAERALHLWLGPARWVLKLISAWYISYKPVWYICPESQFSLDTPEPFQSLIKSDLQNRHTTKQKINFYQTSSKRTSVHPHPPKRIPLLDLWRCILQEASPSVRANLLDHLLRLRNKSISYYWNQTFVKKRHEQGWSNSGANLDNILCKYISRSFSHFLKSIAAATGLVLWWTWFERFGKVDCTADWDYHSTDLFPINVLPLFANAGC